MILQCALDKVYERYLNQIIETREIISGLKSQVLSSPLFLDFTERELASCKRLLFVGKETNGWCNEFSNEILFRQLDHCCIKEYVSELKRQFRIFNYGEHYYNSPFWYFFHMAKNEFNNCTNNTDFLYTNLSRQDENQGAIVTENFYQAVHHQNNLIFRQELKILSPDIVLFFTGPNRDELLKYTFRDLKFIPMNGWQLFKNGNSFICRLQSEDLPVNSFRIYHPESFNRILGKFTEENAYGYVLEFLKQTLHKF